MQPEGGRPSGARLPLDRDRAAHLLLGRGDRPLASGRLLPEAGLLVVRLDALLRVGAVRAGANSQLQVVHAGLRRRGSRGCGGSQQQAARLQPLLQDLGMDLAVGHSHLAAGTSVEVFCVSVCVRAPAGDFTINESKVSPFPLPD